MEHHPSPPLLMSTVEERPEVADAPFETFDELEAAWTEAAHKVVRQMHEVYRNAGEQPHGGFEAGPAQLRTLRADIGSSQRMESINGRLNDPTTLIDVLSDQEEDIACEIARILDEFHAVLRRGISKELRDDSKQLERRVRSTRSIVAPVLISADTVALNLCRDIKGKPYSEALKYPGDIWTMDKIHNLRIGGVGSVGRALDYLTLNMPTCEAVRQRTPFLGEKLARICERNGDDRTKIFIGACGAAPETLGLCASYPVDIIAYDISHAALERLAAHHVRGEYGDTLEIPNHAGSVSTIALVQGNLNDLCAGTIPDPFASEEFDAFEASGIGDYQSDKELIAMLNYAHGHGKPNGVPLVGNVDSSIDEFPMWVSLNWPLIRRTREQYEGLLQRTKFSDNPQNRIEYEQKGINLFFVSNLDEE